MRQTENLNKRQLQALQTRERLLEAGRAVFLEKGFQKATMSQINHLAKTGYGTAYVYFRNKDELFVELMEGIMEKMFAVANLPFHPETKEEAYSQIHEQVYLFMNAGLEEREMMIVVKEAIGISHLVQQKWDEIRTRFIAGITRDIKFVQQAGLAKKELHAPLIAKGWFYMNEQLMWDLITHANHDHPQDIATALTKMYTEGLY